MEQCINKTEDRGQKGAYNEILAYSRDAFPKQRQQVVIHKNKKQKNSLLPDIIHKCKFQKE